MNKIIWGPEPQKASTFFQRPFPLTSFSLKKCIKIKKMVAQRGARTHDPEIKSLVLYRLS